MERTLPLPVAVTVAPNGGRRTKVDHPQIPLTTSEIVRTAQQCLEAGAAMIHIHVRDRNGRHLLDAGAYREVLAETRNAVGDALVLQITTESLGLYAPEHQMDVVRAVKPPAVSLALRELLPDADDPLKFGKFMHWLDREKIVPQIILYDPTEASLLSDLQHRGVLRHGIPVLYVLGRYSMNQTSSPVDLLPFLMPDRPRFDDWSVCAFGPQEAACVCAGALLGGHVRVGFENNLALPGGGIARDVAELVAATAKALRSCGLSLLDGQDLARRWNVARN